MNNLKKIWRSQFNKFLTRGLVGSDVDLLSRFQAVSALEAVVMMTAALAIGLVCGIISVGLNWSVHSIRILISGLELGWPSIFFPAVGAGIAVFLVRNLMHDNEGHGVSSVIKAIATGSGSLKRRMIYSRFFGSLLTVGSGGSTGLEGPIVCIGGALGSALGRWLDMNERHKKLYELCLKQIDIIAHRVKSDFDERLKALSPPDPDENYFKVMQQAQEKAKSDKAQIKSQKERDPQKVEQSIFGDIPNFHSTPEPAKESVTDDEIPF